jgi:hypothetical protein
MLAIHIERDERVSAYLDHQLMEQAVGDWGAGRNAGPICMMPVAVASALTPPAEQSLGRSRPCALACVRTIF